MAAEKGKRSAEDISVGELIMELATEEEKSFASDPMVNLESDISSEDFISMKLAYIYDRRMDQVFYLQQLKKDRNNSIPIPYYPKRVYQAARGITNDKPSVVIGILLVLTVLLSLITSWGLGILVGIILVGLFSAFALKIEKKLLHDCGFTNIPPSIDAIDEKLSETQVILDAARRELIKLEEQGGLPEAAWPFAEQIWDQLSEKKASSVDQAMENLGFEFEDAESE